jgi:hypothetical protein
MSNVKLVNVRLSGNSETTVVNSTEGVNGKCNQTVDGALFCVLELEDRSNPFLVRRATKSIFQQKDNDGKFRWRGATPKEFSNLVGQTIPGSFETRAVEGYMINGNLCHTYTSFVTPNETVETVFKAAGHVLLQVDTETGEVTSNAATMAVNA